jgi:hypothetical protein
MSFNIDDYQNETTWIAAVRGIQVSPNGPTKTSGSAPGANGSSTLTSYTVSEVMQGRATYKPKGATLDLFNQALSKDFEGLRTEKYFIEDKALSPYDVFVGVPSEDPDVVIGVGTPTAPAPTTPGTSGPPPGQLYFMGDSLTYGLTLGGIEAKLTSKGYAPNKVNFDGGRSITGAGQQVRRSGMEAIADDAGFIKDAKHIVIALGTNHENNFAGNLDNLYNAIKQINGDAPIYWVDVAASGISQAFGQEANKAIYAKASSSGMTVISQFKFLWGDDKDPQAYAISGGDPNGLLGGDHIHYSGGAAYGKYADFVVSKLPSAAAAVQGGDNPTIIWNYFVEKKLPPFQIAGIMGNMQAESGLEPRKVQYGTVNSRGEVSVVGQPSSLDDMPANGGWGLVQWTPGTKVLPDANAQNRRPSDIMFQLDHLYMELTSGGEAAAGRAIFATTNVEDAASRFLDRFERPKVNNYADRIAFAKEILKRFAP